MRHQAHAVWKPALAALGVAVLLLVVLTRAGSSQPSGGTSKPPERGQDVFLEIAKVLRHPRCLNCHTTTNFPRQGDDRHPHVNLVRRGPDNRGVAGQRCSTCHQAEDNAASGVPGRPNWHLAPLSMAWEGLGDEALCRALKDPRRNGGRNLEALAEHLAQDPLVGYGLEPGGRRTPVPISRGELVTLMETWSRAGAPCPR